MAGGATATGWLRKTFNFGEDFFERPEERFYSGKACLPSSVFVSTIASQHEKPGFEYCMLAENFFLFVSNKSDKSASQLLHIMRAC